MDKEINTNNIQENKKVEGNNNERKGRGLFYFVIAFAVIIIAVVGATYAYFTATAITGANDITTGSANVTLGLEIDNSGANYKLIPAEENVVKYAYSQQKDITYSETECDIYDTDEMGSPTETCKVYKKIHNSTCVDDSGAEVCSAYSYTVINNNSSAQTLTMYLGTTKNEFANLWFAVYTDTGVDSEGKPIRTRISEPAPVSKTAGTDGEVMITPIVVEDNEEQTAYFNSLAYPTLTADNPTKTYTIVLWIKEMKGDSDPSNDDQTEVDGNGKTFNGYVKVTSGNGNGVTGEIKTDEYKSWTEDFNYPTTSEATSEATS